MNMQVSSPWSVVSSSTGYPGEGLMTTDYGPLTTHGSRVPPRRSSVTAFSLLEAMIACGIFFMAVFAILALVSNTLRNARILRHVQVDAGMPAAELFKTNMVFEGSET